MSSQLHALMFDFAVEQLGDLRLAGMKLALGKFTESPFKREALEGVKWAQLSEVPASAMVMAEGQPFTPDLRAHTLKVLEDPDWEILTSVTDSFATGCCRLQRTHSKDTGCLSGEAEAEQPGQFDISRAGN